MGLDLAAGDCYNQSVPQNLTFGYQGLPLGIGDDAPVNGSADGDESAAASLHGRNSAMAMVAVFGAVFWMTL